MARLTNAQLQIIKTELETDPKELEFEGHDAYWKAAKLSEVGARGETIVEPNDLSMNIIMAEFVLAEVEALDGQQASLLAGIISKESLNPSSAVSVVKAIFGTGTATRANLIALATRPASRAEVLGLPASLMFFHIEQAEALP